MYPTSVNAQRGIIVARLADGLQASGHQVHVCHLGHEGGPIRYLRARTIVAATVKTFSPDVVHVHFGYSGLAVPRLRVPIVTSFYGDDLNGTWTDRGGITLKSKAGILVSQWISLRSRRCIVVSAALRERLWFRIVRDRTVVVRDSVDPTLFRPLARDVARARLGIALDDILILFPHDLSQATKRHWLAEAAVSELRQREPRARLWVVNGRPPQDMPWYYAAADVMVITSAQESGPSSAKEALACGLPVVSVAVGDSQLFDDVPTAMLPAPATPHGLADVLARSLLVSGRRRQSWLPEHLTLAAAVGRVAEVYRTSVSQNSNR